MKTLILVIGLLTSVQGLAQEGTSSQSSQKPSRSQQIREYGMNCGEREMNLIESRFGRPPTDDEMDMILDACVNPRFKE